MKLRHKILTATFLILVFLIIPVFGTGAMWIRHVGLLPGTAVVFSDDAAAMDRFMSAALKPYYGDRVGICDGTNDHVEIQAALDAVDEVLLSVGTFNCAVTIDLDSYQTLRGCGKNTVLVTSTANLFFLSAVGVSGTEKQGIVIRDLRIDGASIAYAGVYWDYVDNSEIRNVWVHDCTSDPWVTEWAALQLLNCDFDKVTSNTCIDNSAPGIALGDRVAGTGTCTFIAIENNISKSNGYGIYVRASSYNSVTGNICQDNTTGNIYLVASTLNTISANICQDSKLGVGLLSHSNNNTVTGNICQGNIPQGGIYVDNSSGDTISSNHLQANNDGIHIEASDYMAVTDNTCRANRIHGIDIKSSSDCSIVGNYCLENSQSTNNSYDDICVESNSDHNHIQGNTCRAGALANKPRYGINIADAACNENLVIDNDLYNDGFATAPFNDAGTQTKLNTYKVPFSDGSDPQFSGFQIDAATELARTWLRLPDKVVQVVRIKVYAVALDAEADKMRAEFTILGGASNEAANTHIGSVVNHPSTTSNFAAIDVIYWTITTAGVLALVGGDSVVVEVVYEDAGDGDCATNADFRTVEIEYV